VSDDVDEIVKASSTIIINHLRRFCALLFNEVLTRKKGVILSGLRLLAVLR